MTNSDLSTDSPPSWQSLSIWSVVHYIFKWLGLIYNQIFVLVPISIAVYQSGLTALYFGLPLSIAVLIILAAWLDYRFFSYQIHDGEVLVKQGILSKRQLNLKFERIQNINSTQPFYFRPLGLVTLSIDGAGSKAEEVQLSALTRAEAARIKANILALQTSQSSGACLLQGTELGEAQTTASVDVFKRRLPDLICHGLTNINLFVLVVLGVLYTQLQDFFNSLVSEETITSLASTVASPVWLLMGVVLFLIVLVLSFSVAWVVIKYHRYELTHAAEDLSVHHGLFTRHELQTRKSRIQRISYRQKWIEAWFQRFNVRFESLSYSPGGAGGQGHSRLLVPWVTLSEAAALSGWLLPNLDPAHLDYHGANLRWSLVKAGQWLLAVSFLVLFCLLLMPLFFGVWIGVGCGFVFAGWVIIYAQSQKMGIALAGNCIVIRSGSFSSNYEIFQTHKLQQIHIRQTRMMRRKKCTTLLFQTAAGKTTMPYIDERVAREIVDVALYQLESSDQSWM